MCADKINGKDSCKTILAPLERKIDSSERHTAQQRFVLPVILILLLLSRRARPSFATLSSGKRTLRHRNVMKHLLESAEIKKIGNACSSCQDPPFVCLFNQNSAATISQNLH